ncbi:hypothetical protein ACB098_02G145200 [Castanea mollissima]
MNKPPKPKLVCFSFAAYAKTLICHLKSSNIPIIDGLSDSEFTSIETTFGFSFPPDLRSILREGIPVGPGFPNWRSSSPQQLHILLNLPTLGLLKQVSQGKFWSHSWGTRPDDTNEALALAKQSLNKAPVLVPIYRNFYIPSRPNIAGNPVFYVNGRDVYVSSFDVSGFFQEAEFLNVPRTKAPAWTATTARRIEFWTDEAARSDTRWWSGDLGTCLEEVFWRLRNGGWKEEEVREMMMMMNGDDEERKGGPGLVRCKESVKWHVQVLSLKLLRAGWSREDVVYSLDLVDESGILEEHSFLDFQVKEKPKSCSKVNDDRQRLGIKQLMQLHSLES